MLAIMDSGDSGERVAGGVMSYCCVSFCTVMNMLANLFLHSDGREL